MSESNDIERRTVVKGLGSASAIALTGILGSNPVAASSGIDTEFDPNDRSELKRFSQDFRGLTTKRQRSVYKSLSDRRRTAVDRVFSPDKFEITLNHPEEVTLASTESSRKAEISAYSTPFGSHLWDWYHEVTWEHNGSSVWDVNSNDWAEVHDPTWSYDGTTSNSKDVEDSEFEAFRQGGLSFIGGDISFSADPYARIEGFSNGNSSIIDKDDGY